MTETIEIDEDEQMLGPNQAAVKEHKRKFEKKCAEDFQLVETLLLQANHKIALLRRKAKERKQRTQLEAVTQQLQQLNLHDSSLQVIEYLKKTEFVKDADLHFAKLQAIQQHKDLLKMNKPGSTYGLYKFSIECRHCELKVAYNRLSLEQDYFKNLGIGYARHLKHSK